MATSAIEHSSNTHNDIANQHKEKRNKLAVYSTDGLNIPLIDEESKNVSSSGQECSCTSCCHSSNSRFQSLLHARVCNSSDTSYCSKNSGHSGTIHSTTSRNYASDTSLQRKMTAEDTCKRDSHRFREFELENVLPEFEERKARRQNKYAELNNRKLRNYPHTIGLENYISSNSAFSVVQPKINNKKITRRVKRKRVPFQWVKFHDQVRNKKYFR